LRLIIGSEHIDEEFAGAIIDFLIKVQPAAEGVDALLLAADCYAEISNKNKIPTITEQLLYSLKAAFNQEKKIQAITQKILTLWSERADVKAWLEDQALNHQKESVRRAIAQGMAAVELPHLVDVNFQIQRLGDLYLNQNRFEEAIRAYLHLNSIEHFAKNGLAKAFLELKKYDEAIAIFQGLVKSEPMRSHAYASLGYTYNKAGRFGEAINVYNRAIEIDKSSLNRILVSQGMAWTHTDMGQYSLALEYYEQLIVDVSDFGFGLNQSICKSNLGSVYQDLGVYELAKDAYCQAISLGTGRAVPHLKLGVMYRILESWEDAVHFLQIAVGLDPACANAHNSLGCLYLLQGDLDRAESAFKTAIQINSYYGFAILSMGLLQALRGNMENAKLSWQAGLNRYGEHAQVERLFRAVYTVALGQGESGLDLLRSILNQERPPSGLLRYVLETTRLLQRCPGQIAGIEDVSNLLEAGIRNAPVFKLKSKQEN
jgi:tetratricopeptide (TPR) repeat protein